MKFIENTTFDAYANGATKEFGEMEKRLSGINDGFVTKMRGKTTGGLVGSLIVTFLWIAAVVALVVYGGRSVDSMLLTVTVIAAMGMFLFMIIDNLMNFSYYGKLSGYQNQVKRLSERVQMGKSSMKSNRDAFMASREKGWRYALTPGASIPEEAASIEETVSGMETLQAGFIHGAKNVFFYGAVVMISILSCVTLFPVGVDLMQGLVYGILDDSLSYDTARTLCIIASVIVTIAGVILARLIWSKNDCNVTNTTLFSFLIPPAAFLLLILVGTLLVMLVVALVGVVLALAGIAVAGACLFGMTSGG